MLEAATLSILVYSSSRMQRRIPLQSINQCAKTRTYYQLPGPPKCSVGRFKYLISKAPFRRTLVNVNHDLDIVSSENDCCHSRRRRSVGILNYNVGSRGNAYHPHILSLIISIIDHHSNGLNCDILGDLDSELSSVHPHHVPPVLCRQSNGHRVI